jgi:hypothetical protein
MQQWMLVKEPPTDQLMLEDGSVTNEEPQRIFLTQDISAHSFAVRVSRFKPGPEDATGFTWKEADGVKRVMDLPALCISDMDETTASLRLFINAHRFEYVERLTYEANPILRKTFEEAERYLKATPKVGLFSPSPPTTPPEAE